MAIFSKEEIHTMQRAIEDYKNTNNLKKEEIKNIMYINQKLIWLLK